MRKLSHCFTAIAVLCCTSQSFASNILDILPPPLLECSTSSNGYSFSRQGRDTQLLIRLIIGQCQASAATSNQECSANVACNDGAYYAPFVSCTTSSNTYNFTDQSRDPSLARSEAIRQCQASAATNNQECSANVACSSNLGPMPPVLPMISCTTSSNGFNFTDQSRDPSLARSEAIRQCQASAATSNQECSANVACNDGSYYHPMISCGTTSNAYNFTDQSRDPSLARSEAIRQCQASAATNNQECSANVACNDGQYYAPFVSCTTSSNGYNFTDQSRDPSLARSEAIRQCQASAATNNQECSANVYCHAQ